MATDETSLLAQVMAAILNQNLIILQQNGAVLAAVLNPIHEGPAQECPHGTPLGVECLKCQADDTAAST